MDGRSKSVVVAFVVAMAVGLVAEAAHKGSGKAGRRIGRSSRRATGSKRRLVPTRTRPSASSHKLRGSGAVTRRTYGYGAGGTFDTTENSVPGGARARRRLRYDSPGDDTFGPRRRLYDSPGDDTFVPRPRLYDSPGDDT